MKDALNNFNNIKLEGKWNALSADQEKIMALQAIFNLLKDTELKLSKEVTDPKQAKEGKKSDKKKKKSSKKQKGKEMYAWKKVPPKNGETTKVVDGETYYWCEDHQVWMLHKPEDCELRKKRLADDQKKAEEKGDEGVPRQQHMPTFLIKNESLHNFNNM